MLGIFDSGLGGLITLQEISKIIPNYPIIYLGDLANLPYGNKSKQTITQLSKKNVRFLKNKGARKIVIACNTASAYAVESLQKKFPKITFFDVISPSVKTAVKSTKNQKIGVIATKATIQSSVYSTAISNINPKIKIFTQACPLLVPLIEEGWEKEPVADQILKKYLEPLKKAQVDTLILGCTHYPVLKPKIQKILGETVRIIDSSQEVAKVVKKYLDENPNPQVLKQSIKYYVTDFSPGLEKISQRFTCQKQKPHFKKIYLY